MAVYAGMDLHSTNSYVAVVDEEGKKVYKKKLRTRGRQSSQRWSLPGRA